MRIEDIAKASGFSTATVSRVLNGSAQVTEKTREQVMSAVRALHYFPNAHARTLVRKRTNLLGIIASGISTNFISTILGSVEQAASERGYHIMVCDILRDFSKEEKYIRIFQEMRVDGMILMYEKVTDGVLALFESMDTPVVCCSVRPPELRYPFVSIDDCEAARSAMEYLISLGHEDIAFFSDSLSEFSSGQQRHEGATRALGAHGLPLKPALFRDGGIAYEDGYAMMEDLIASGAEPSAVFACSDDAAVGAIACLYDHGLSVPGDVSVMGFDGSGISRFIRPQLTTVQQPIAQLGKTAVDMLCEYIKNPDNPPESIYLPYNLKLAASCAPKTQ